MNTSRFKSSSSTIFCELDSLKSVKNQNPVGPNRSLENLFITSKLERKNSGGNMHPEDKKVLLSAKRRSKSEILLNITETDLEENITNEFSEKTGELLVKALKDSIEDRKGLYDKTELENDQEYSGENCDYTNYRTGPDNMMMPMSSPPPGVVTDSQGLIVPKKLTNPCQESSDRKNLHRELLFNQKIGKNVLNQKSELQRALEKQKERQLLMQQQQQQEKDIGMKSELNKVIMERAQKLEKKNNTTNQEEINAPLNPEYLSARAKLRTRLDSK